MAVIFDISFVFHKCSSNHICKEYNEHAIDRAKSTFKYFNRNFTNQLYIPLKSKHDFFLNFET